MPSDKPKNSPPSAKASGKPKGAPPSATATGSGQDAGWLYAQVHGRRRGSKVLTWALWLAVSILIHVAVLLTLRVVKLGTGYLEPEPIRLDTDLVETFRVPPITYRTSISLDETVSAAERAAQLGEALKPSTEPVPVLGVDPLDLGAMKLDLLAKKDTSTGPRWHRSSDLARKIDRGERRDYRGVMDDVAADILKEIRKRRLLVAVLFDRSISLWDDRKLLTRQLERTFRDLKFAMTDREEKHLKWAVVMYGQDVALQLKPTQEIAAVRKAIANMPFDDSGEENVINALNYTVNELSSKADRMFVMLLTDEQGDDVGIDPNATAEERKALNLAVARCKKKRTNVYTLGREVFFQRASIPVTITGPDDIVAHGHQFLGFPTCRSELPSTIGFCGMNVARVQAGFGSYALTLLAYMTKGKFFVLSDDAPRYTDRGMRPYAPEWCFPDEYDKRNHKSKLRTALLDTIEQMSTDLPPGSAYAFESDWQVVKATLRSFDHRLNNKIKWCDKRIRKLVDFTKEISRQEHSRKRWEANYDLTIALLYKMKAILLQYRALISKLKYHAEPRLDEPDHRHRCDLFLAKPDDKSVRFAQGRDEKQALDKAKRALEKVMRKHRNTPWAVRARLEIDSIAPATFRFTSVPPPPPPTMPTTPPPEPKEPPPGV